MTGFYSVLSYSQNTKEINEDIFIGIKQASQYVNGTQYISIDDAYHYTSYDKKEMSLEFDNHRLVKKEGYEILIHDIDELNFEIKNDFIYINLSRDDNDYSFLLTSVLEKKEVVDNEEIE